MKVTRWLMLAGLAAALSLSVNSSLAQGNGGGGGRRNGGGGFGGGNFDPAQMQQMMMDRTKERLEITDDTEWKAIEPLVQKVMDLQRQTAANRMGGMRGGRRGQQQDGGDAAAQPRRNPMFTPMPEAEALQKAIDSKASNAELKTALAKYNTAMASKQAELEQARANLRKVLTVRQEALATVSGLL